MDLTYPPVGFHFRVAFNLPGVTTADARFAEVSGLSAELGIEELVEGGENRYSHRLPARAKYPNLVLKRGLLTESALIQWFSDAIEQFVFTPTDVLVSLLNDQHEPLASWTFVRAWPVKWVVSDLKANENAIAVETIELAFAQMRRVVI